jgi:hypothetical protein
MQTAFYRKPTICHMAIHLLLKANHEPQSFICNGKKEIIDTGQILTGRKVLANETGQSQQQVRTALSTLSDPTIGFLTIKSTNKYSIISIGKYLEYQEKSTSKSTNKQPTTNQQLTTNKNDKNDKNDKNTTMPEATVAANDGQKPVNWENCRTDLQRFIAHYVRLEMPALYQNATQAQANGVFKRYGRAASEILAVAGDLTTAKAAFDKGRAVFGAKGLSWNLSTISKNIAEFVNYSMGEKHGN